MARDKYHAEIKFHWGQVVRFTAVDLEHLMKRFNAEVEKEQQRLRDEKQYTYVVPRLFVEVCSSWAEFEQYEHVR